MNELEDKKPGNHNIEIKKEFYEGYFSENPEIKKLQIEALEAHLLFDENRCYRFPPNINFDVRKHRLSFHNFEHIKAAVEGAIILFDEAFKNNNDIFNLKADLDKWNQGKGEEERISFEELADVFRLAFSFHDLGNISDGEVDENGKVVLRSSCLYQAKGAEERSVQIAEKLIGENPELKKHLPLVRHIIQETKFNFNQEAGRNSPFAVFVRVVDQILTNYLRRDYPEFVEGLTIEFNEEFNFKDKGETDFSKRRFPYLISDDSEKNQEKIKKLTSQLMEIIKPHIPKNNKIPSLV